MKNKIKVVMAALVVIAMACDPKSKATETINIDTMGGDSSSVVSGDSTRTGVLQNDSAFVTK